MDQPARTQSGMAVGTFVVLVLLAAEWLAISGTVREESQTAVLNLAIATTALGVGVNAVLLARLRGDVRTATRRLHSQVQDRAPAADPGPRERYVVVSVDRAGLYHLPRCPLVVRKDVRWLAEHQERRRACGVCIDG